MGIWDNLFGTGNEDQNAEDYRVRWIALNSKDQLGQISLLSGTKVQLIYKHSTSCGISGMVLKRLERNLVQNEYIADCYFLDLRRHREISDAIEAQYGVRHESPQLLIIENGKVVATASHGAIAEMEFEAYMEKKDPGA